MKLENLTGSAITTTVSRFGRTGRAIFRETRLGNLVRREVTGVNGVSSVRWIKL